MPLRERLAGTPPTKASWCVRYSDHEVPVRVSSSQKRIHRSVVEVLGRILNQLLTVVRQSAPRGPADVSMTGPGLMTSAWARLTSSRPSQPDRWAHWAVGPACQRLGLARQRAWAQSTVSRECGSRGPRPPDPVRLRADPVRLRLCGLVCVAQIQNWKGEKFPCLRRVRRNAAPAFATRATRRLAVRARSLASCSSEDSEACRACACVCALANAPVRCVAAAARVETAASSPAVRGSASVLVRVLCACGCACARAGGACVLARHGRAMAAARPSSSRVPGSPVPRLLARVRVREVPAERERLEGRANGRVSMAELRRAASRGNQGGARRDWLTYGLGKRERRGRETVEAVTRSAVVVDVGVRGGFTVAHGSVSSRYGLAPPPGSLGDCGASLRSGVAPPSSLFLLLLLLFLSSTSPPLLRAHGGGEKGINPERAIGLKLRRGRLLVGEARGLRWLGRGEDGYGSRESRDPAVTLASACARSAAGMSGRQGF
nr:unnamed protein product [Digitaria exilis]